MPTEAQPQPKPTFGATRTQPFTSQEFMESLRDGREIWIYGERVKDVTTHRAFKPIVDIRARIYDMAHEKATAPAPGSIVMTEPKTINAPSKDSMKMSIIDQRPIKRTTP